jgi:nitrate/TMAO reductase-like tetraheme cytochrome c subunit
MPNDKNIMCAVKYKKRFWTILVLICSAILIVAAGGIGYLVRFSATNDAVCAQCHPELIDLWKNSNGHPAHTTSCFACHSDRFIPPEYSADDSLTSRRCLDCHGEVLELGYTIKKKIVKYNHRIHRQEGLECIDCHRTAGHEYASEGTNRPSVAECILCHIREFDGPPKSQECLNCHDVMLAPGRTWKDD